MINNTIVLTEAGKKIGMGHFVRMSAVCEELRDNDIPVRMLLNSDETVNSMTNLNYVEYCNWNDGSDSMDYINAVDTVILDSYLAGYEKINEINRKCKKLIVIDDNIRLNYSNVTIINPNYFGMFLSYPQNRGNVIYTGSGCTLLRKPFNRFFDRKIADEVSNVLITMGGTDVKNVTLKVIRYIKALDSEVSLHVVVTDAYDEIDKINCNLGANDNLYKGIDADQMSELMRLADFAVASAGGTTNELIKMLCPCVLIGVADNQLLNLRYLSENGYIREFSMLNMNPIKEMFMFEQRLRLYNKMKSTHSNETGVSVILKEIRGENV